MPWNPYDYPDPFEKVVQEYASGAGSPVRPPVQAAYEPAIPPAMVSGPVQARAPVGAMKPPIPGSALIPGYGVLAAPAEMAYGFLNQPAEPGGQQVVTGTGEPAPVADPDLAPPMQPPAQAPMAEPEFKLPPRVRIGVPTIDPLFDPAYRDRDLRLRSQQAKEQRESGILQAKQAKKLAEQKFKGVEQAGYERMAHDAKIAKVQARQARVIAEYQKKNAEVEKWAGPDPGRWFSKKFGKEGPQRILGAFLVGMSGTSDKSGNLTFGLVDKFVQRDVDQQIKEYQAKKGGQKGRQNLISMLQGQVNDLSLNRERAMAFQQKQASEYFKGLAYKTDSPILKQKAMMEATKLDMAANDRQNAIFEREQSLIAQRRMMQQKARARAAAAGGGGIKRAMQKIKLQKAMLDLKKKQKELMQPGSGKPASAKMQAKLSASIEGRKTLARIMKSLGEGEAKGKARQALVKMGRSASGGLLEYASEGAAKQAHTEGKIGGMVAQHIKSMSGADAKESEIDRFRPLHVRIGDDKKARLRKFIHWASERRSSLKASLTANPNTPLRKQYLREIAVNDVIINKAKKQIQQAK